MQFVEMFMALHELMTHTVSSRTLLYFVLKFYSSFTVTGWPQVDTFNQNTVYDIIKDGRQEIVLRTIFTRNVYVRKEKG